MPRKLRDSVVVITGASSGIGAATALEMARRGATVVLAARSEHALNKIASECRNVTLQVLAVPTDVTDSAAVQVLADRAIESFGRIDVWVNNAAVSMIARFEDAPADAVRRVIETNLMGYVDGARAALRYFREQDSGVLINVSSQVAFGGQPYASPYVMTKYAIRGLTDCLRQEFLNSDIHICTVLPGSVDTTHYLHAANYTGKAVKPIGPILDPQCVARVIADLAENPQHEVIVGRSGYLISTLHGLAPSIYERAATWTVNRAHFQDATAEHTSGNLFEPLPQLASISGGWRKRQSAYNVGTALKLGISAIGLTAAIIGLIRLKR